MLTTQRDLHSAHGNVLRAMLVPAAGTEMVCSLHYRRGFKDEACRASARVV